MYVVAEALIAQSFPLYRSSGVHSKDDYMFCICAGIIDSDKIARPYSITDWFKIRIKPQSIAVGIFSCSKLLFCVVLHKNKIRLNYFFLCFFLFSLSPSWIFRHSAVNCFFDFIFSLLFFFCSNFPARHQCWNLPLIFAVCLCF